jgi:hypothetical protein
MDAWRFRLLRAAPWVLPLAALGLNAWMVRCGADFDYFAPASFSPALTEAMVRPWPVRAGCALALLLALGASIVLGPRLRRLLIGGSLAVSVATLAAVEIGVAWPFSQWTFRAWRIARRAAAAGTSHPWAGSYFMTGGVDLHLAPDGEFVRTWTGCTGRIRAFGTVSEREGHLVLHPEASPAVHTDMVLDVVPWGERRYLVERGHLVDFGEWIQWGQFCTMVFDGSEPRRDIGGYVLLRRDDWRREAPGMPVVPAGVEPCFRGEHAETPVASVDERGVFRLPGGLAQGFHRTERISLRSPSGEVAYGQLVDVRENESVGEREEDSRGFHVGPGWTVMASAGRPSSP